MSVPLTWIMPSNKLEKKESKTRAMEKRSMARRNSYQEGSVALKGGKWTLRYRVRDPNSKSGWIFRREVLENCKGEKDARKIADEIMRGINDKNSSPGENAELTVAGFVGGLWQAYLDRKQVKPSTRYSYESMLKRHVLPNLGDKRLDEITPVDMTSFFRQVQGNRASKYLLNLYALLNTMLEVAVEYDLIESSPLRKKLHRPLNIRKRKTAVSAEQIRRVLECVPDQHRAVFTCVALTGLRVGELLGLRWGNVDFAAGTLTITHSLWRGRLQSPKTEASAATIRMSSALSETLEAHKQQSDWRDTDDFVFSRSDGSPWDPDFLRKEVLYPALDAAGIVRGERSHGFHLFRHSAGSIIHAATGDLKLAQEQLRHTQISTTSDIYVHVERQVAQKASDVLAKEIFANCALVVPSASRLIH